MTDTDSNLIASEVALILRCQTPTARRLMAAGEIEAAKVAGQWIAKKSAVDAYQDSLTNGRQQRRRRRRSA